MVRCAQILGWVVLLAALAGTGCGGKSGPERPEGNLFLSDWFLNIAHRGGTQAAPEESLAAFENAVDVGADVLEMDLHATADGVVVCMHDADVDRTTDGTGAIKDMTFSQLRELDAGYRYTTDGGQSYPYRGRGVVVPAFSEVLQAFGDQYFITEIKQSDPPMVDEVLQALEEAGVSERVIVAATDDSVIAEVRQKSPEIFTSFAVAEMLTFATLGEAELENYQPPAGFLHPPSEVVDESFLARARRFELKVHAWTVNDRETMEQLLDLNIDGIMTDDPALIESIIDERGLH